ncbi:MAG TPA: NAD(P)/FAD-dependent oxidoreductase, partial [Dehalococcoidia bacterium]|nr:NAD(P)/FAD-dependent oxidoreductase [Dehalococcoidia bacterium]
LKAVDHGAKTLEFADGLRQPFDMVIATPVHRVPEVLVQSRLAAASEWMKVDRETLEVAGQEHVFAIGDCNAVPIVEGATLPKAGVFAHGEAEVVCRNVAAEIEGVEPIWAYGGQGACFLDTGGGKAAYVNGNFFAEPPAVTMRRPSRFAHWQKLGFERLWLWRWF